MEQEKLIQEGGRVDRRAGDTDCSQFFMMWDFETKVLMTKKATQRERRMMCAVSS